MGRFLFLAIALSLVGGCAPENLDTSCTYGTTRGILNGTPDSTCHFSQVLKVQIQGSRAAADCSGVLVRSDAVLTAAHCISDPQLGKVEAVQVRAGKEVISARKWLGNPKFRANSHAPGMYGVDIALLFLGASLAGATPVTLATRNPAAGTAVTAVGFGYDGRGSDGNGRLGRRLVGELRVEEAQMTGYPEGITAMGPQQTCEGDSGGPLLQNGVLVGILSGGDVAGSGAACVDSVSSVYSSVPNLLDWIQSTLTRN